jgi:hypothetical protein
MRFKTRRWMEMISLTIRLSYPHQELLGTEDAGLLGCYVVSVGKFDRLALKMEALYSLETSATVFQSTRLEHRCESLISKPVPVEWESQWVPEMVWMLGGRVDFLAFTRDRTPITGSSHTQPSTLQVQNFMLG